MIDSRTYNSFTDQQIVQGILNNDQQVIKYFFFDKCSSLFTYIVRSVFDEKVCRDELVSELFLYLQTNNWYKIKQFDYRSTLITWVSVVAIRFFVKKRNMLLDCERQTTQYTIEEKLYTPSIDSKVDLYSAISRMPNQRYAAVIKKLDLYEEDPKQVALELGITLDNLYNLRRRARLQLRTMLDYNSK